MYCIFLPLIHKSVHFYEKAIFMGELSVGRIVRWVNCPWANCPRVNWPWANRPVTIQYTSLNPAIVSGTSITTHKVKQASSAVSELIPSFNYFLKLFNCGFCRRMFSAGTYVMGDRP